MKAHPQALSSVRVNFGERQSSPTPIDFNLNIQLFSSEYETLKNEIAQRFNADIPSSCAAFEFQCQNSTGATADQLREQVKKLVPKDVEQKTKISVYRSKDRILVLLESSEFKEKIKEIENGFSHLKQQVGKDSNQVNLRLSSHNDGMTIWELANAQGVQAAIFNSLHLNFSFVKSDTIVKFIEVILGMAGVDHLHSMVKSFYKVNLELNMGSGFELSQYPQVHLRKPSKQAKKTDVADFLMASGMEKGRVFVFNQTVLLKGDINVSGLISVLKLAYKE